MAVNSELNLLGQELLTVPHVKMLESGVRGDFDALAYMLVGETSSIVKGFDQVGIAIGYSASLLKFKVSGAKVIHPLASENGSIFSVSTTRDIELLDPTTNTRMTGACQPSSTNYIGIDLKRTADASTADSMQFLDPSTDTEFPQKIPTRRTLDYQWIISKTPFSFNLSVAPVAIVVTDEYNNVASFHDARTLFGRLTPGGDNQNDVVPYSWPGRNLAVETDAMSSVAGDKSLTSLKTWMQAVMTKLWEISGGQYWYSLAADRNVHLNTGTTLFTSTGESFEVDSDNLHWQGISFSFDNSPQHSIAVNDQTTSMTGLTDLADGECIYVDLDRTSTSTIQAQKGVLSLLGGSLRPGQRWVIAIRRGAKYYVSGQPWPVGSSMRIATISHTGVMKTNMDIAGSDPVAATVLTTVGPRTGMVVGSGISNGFSYGSALANSTVPGPVIIGDGNENGDLDVRIFTDGGYTTFVSGRANTGDTILAVEANSSGGGLFGNASAGSTIANFAGLIRIEGTGATNVWAGAVLPRPPAPGAVKQFVSQTSVFKSACKYTVIDFASDSWTYDASAKTMTRVATGRLAFDGIVLLVATDRVLVNVDGCLFNGIYSVTNDASSDPSTQHVVMTRAGDASGPGSVLDQGIGFDLFDGVSVKVTDGSHFGGTIWRLNALKIAGSVLVDGTQTHSWYSVPDTTTCETVCTMFWDGSYAVLSTGPAHVVSTI